ncbi:hypothetical protein BaRGS_00009369 [Batillaria attramentaria]|uniref:NADP-dependent oxidoreductase domain-containing protein n=1 Tax=Batillaria attramentaria TaxID=370345 RepID=A0ABD0LIQ7_9CAEN
MVRFSSDGLTGSNHHVKGVTSSPFSVTNCVLQDYVRRYNAPVRGATRTLQFSTAAGTGTEPLLVLRYVRKTKDNRTILGMETFPQSISKLPVTYNSELHDEATVKRMPYRPLGNTGLDVSILSYGASSLGSVFRQTDDSESIQVVHEAVKNGINYIDTAPWYGHGKSETVLGKALQGIPRSSYYLATKVGRYLPDPAQMFDFSAERTLRSVDESLARLGLDYVDIIQIHDMEFADNLDIIISETLPALQKVKDAGKARFIGITGYPLENFRTVLERTTVKVDTILTYCHASMNDNSLADYLPYFKSKGIGVVNASPISMGLLSDRGPPAWHPAHRDIKDACAAAAKFCQSRGVDISRLAMEFTLSQADIPTTLVSTASLKNLNKNIESVYKPLTAEEKAVQQEVMDRFMKPLNNKNWEGVEVGEHRKQLQASAATS